MYINDHRTGPRKPKLTAVHQLPVVEDGLRERLARRRRAELAVEAERLHDGQERLDGEHGGSGPLLLREDLSTTLVEHGVDTANGVLRALDLDYMRIRSGVFRRRDASKDTYRGRRAPGDPGWRASTRRSIRDGKWG